MKWSPSITRREFELDYCGGDSDKESMYRIHKITLPCCCGDASCRGWAAIRVPAVIEHICGGGFPDLDDLYEWSYSEIGIRDEASMTFAILEALSPTRPTSSRLPTDSA